MKLTLAESRLLKEPINIISELVNEVTFKIDSNKIELIAMDPANVAMVVFRLLSSAFIDYSIEKPLEISINLDNLKQVLRRAKPSDTIILELEDNKLKIELSGDSKRVFHLSLIKLDNKSQKIPELDFPVNIETSTSIFNEAIEDMDIIADSVLLTVDKSRLSVEASGSLSKAKVDIALSDDTKINMKTESKVKSKYSLEYLKKIIKGSKLTNTALIHMANDYPLKIQYKLTDKLDLEFILAPRVQND